MMVDPMMLKAKPSPPTAQKMDTVGRSDNASGDVTTSESSSGLPAGLLSDKAQDEDANEYHHDDIHEHDTSTVHDGEGSEAGAHQKDAGYLASIGKNESKNVFYTRALVLAVLVGVAASVSAVVFLYARNVEKESFETYFRDVVSEKVISEFIGGADRRITVIESFASEVTSYALEASRRENNGTSVWPNVALPDYARRARYAIELSDVLSMIFIPIVTKEEEKSSWEAFSVENQGWVKEGLALQENPPAREDEQEWLDILDAIVETPDDLGIPEELYRLTRTGSEPETGPGPYAPWWQLEPMVPTTVGINYNAFSHPEREGPLFSVLENKKPLLTAAYDYGAHEDSINKGKAAALNLFLLHGTEKNRRAYEAGPCSDIYVPIFETYEKDSEVVGELTAYVYWQVYFENILAERDIGIYVILENSCGQVFTYRIDGHDVTYLGQGDDFHDAETYEHLAVSTDYGSFLEFKGDINDLPEGQCLYRLRVYPSDELLEVHTTNGPLRFSLILAGTFAFTCLVFLLYDFLVEHRQRVVMDTAVKSSAVVASLFPEEVRDRLYEEERTKHDNNQNSKNTSGGNKKANSFHVSDVGTMLRKTSSDDDDFGEALQEDGGLDDPMAIADLYPACTVLFCDIVGFTHWSSSREPVQVFKLLETIFKMFDKVATRLGVFKVETIGDCYVAVTGLPHSQPDHAIRMAKFAAECLAKISRVTHRLADQLGPETTDLKVRIGMNSGPVTAGVLRGAKARFQLFGDTVNTAARMESTGLAMKIQVSSSTADLIKQGGNSDWIRERSGEVEAKGKGTMQTYWLEQKEVVDQSTSTDPASTNT